MKNKSIFVPSTSHLIIFIGRRGHELSGLGFEGNLLGAVLAFVAAVVAAAVAQVDEDATSRLPRGLGGHTHMTFILRGEEGKKIPRFC